MLLDSKEMSNLGLESEWQYWSETYINIINICFSQADLDLDLSSM